MATQPSQSALVTVFDACAPVEHAIDALRRAGFQDNQIGLVIPGDNQSIADRLDEEAGRRAPQGLAIGAAAGGVLGAAVALLIPGFGPVAAWGILTVALESAALGAAAGGLIGGLSALGMSENDARLCEDQIKNGHPVVVVKANGRDTEARKILRGFGSVQAA